MWRSTRRPARRGRSARAGARARRWSGRRAQGQPRRPRPRCRRSGDDSEYDVWTRSDAVAGDGKEQYEEQYDRLAAEPIVKKIQLGQTDNGRDIWALKVTKDAKTTRRQHASRRPLQRDAARPRVARRRDLPAHARLYFVDNYGRTGNAIDHDGDEIPTWRRAGHGARGLARAVVHVRRQPGRLRVHVHARATACGARTCATTTATARSRSATASTRTATTRRTGASTRRARRTTRRRRPTAAPAPTPRPRPRR